MLVFSLSLYMYIYIYIYMHTHTLLAGTTARFIYTYIGNMLWSGATARASRRSCATSPRGGAY